MRYSTSANLMLAAIAIGEVVAGPTHAHLHKHMREKKDVDWNALDWNNMGIDWEAAYAAGQKTAVPTTTEAPVPTAAPVVEVAANNAAQPTTTSAPAPAVAATVDTSVSDSSSSNIVDDVKSLFAGLVGASNSRKSFGQATQPKGSVGDFYIGNVGAPYGSNVMKVASAEGYDFTNTFVNTQKVGITVNVWQKAGSDMQPLSGSAKAPEDTTLTFYLKPGAEQVVAFQADTQIAWAQPCSKKAGSGAYATTWGEANFVPTGSGYDVSAILNADGNNYQMKITSTEAPACTSSNTENFWVKEFTPVGNSDGSCYIAQSSAHLRTEMGGTM